MLHFFFFAAFLFGKNFELKAHPTNTQREFPDRFCASSLAGWHLSVQWIMAGVRYKAQIIYVWSLASPTETWPPPFITPPSSSSFDPTLQPHAALHLLLLLRYNPLYVSGQVILHHRGICKTRISLAAAVSLRESHNPHLTNWTLQRNTESI